MPDKNYQLTETAVKATADVVHRFRPPAPSRAGTLTPPYRPALRGFWAIITASSPTTLSIGSGGTGNPGSPYKYAWIEQVDAYDGGSTIEFFKNKPATPDGGCFGTIAGNSSGADCGPAFNSLEIPANSPLNGLSPVPNETYVWMELSMDDDTPPKACWRFSGGLPQIAWIEITSAMPPASTSGAGYTPPALAGAPNSIGGGGFYNARLVTGAPVTTDPTTDLIAPCSPTEALGPANGILAQNWFEANLDDPGSHMVEPSTFAPAWLVGMSNEAPTRPHYRFFAPGRGLISLSGIFGNVEAAPITLGPGRYYATANGGGVANADLTTAFGGTITGGVCDLGWGSTYYDLVGADVLFNCIFCNLAEYNTWGNAASGGGHIIGCGGNGYSSGGCAMGFFAGVSSITISGVPTLVPVVYGWAMNCVFPVNLRDASGSPGAFTYTAYSYSDFEDELATTISPAFRPANATVAAQAGLGMFQGGNFILLFAFEDEALGFNGTFVDHASVSHTVVNGRITT